MAKNKQNKPKKASKKVSGELTSMVDNSSESKNSKNGFMEAGGNSKANQLR